MRIKILFLLFLFFLAVTNVFADTILLKSGTTVEGNIVERNADSLKLEVEGIPLTYYISDIDSINGQKVVQGSASPSTTSTSLQENSSGQTQTENVTGQKQEEVNQPQVMETNPIDKQMPSAEKIEPLPQEKGTLSEQSKTISKDDPPASSFDAKSSRKTSLTPEQARVAVGIFAGLFLFITIIVIIGYVYSAFCLYFISKKLAVEPAWLAWIPIANAFLMCKIAGLSYLWLLGLLVQFLPFIGFLGILYGIGLFIYFWYKIIILRNKPAWLIVLMIIPIANLVVMGYLAFSE